MKYTWILIILLVSACSNTGSKSGKLGVPTNTSGGFDGVSSPADFQSPVSDALDQASKALDSIPSTGDPNLDVVIGNASTALDDYSKQIDDLIAASQEGDVQEAIALAAQADQSKEKLEEIAKALDAIGYESLGDIFRAQAERNQVWRLFCPANVRHLYSVDLATTLQTFGAVCVVEGIAFALYPTSGSGRVPVKQCGNSQFGTIFLSTDLNCEGLGDQDGGVLGYGTTSQVDESHWQLFRAYSPQTNDALSTAADGEIAAVQAYGYVVAPQNVFVPMY